MAARITYVLWVLMFTFTIVFLLPVDADAEDFCWTDTGENHIYCKVEKDRIWLEPIGWTTSFAVSDKYVADDESTFYLLLLRNK